MGLAKACFVIVLVIRFVLLLTHQNLASLVEFPAANLSTFVKIQMMEYEQSDRRFQGSDLEMQHVTPSSSPGTPGLPRFLFCCVEATSC